MLVNRGNARSQPWHEVHRIRSDMNRLFSSLGRDWPMLAASYPPMNVWQDGDNLYLEAELPGMDLSDLEIYVIGGDQLTIKGERKPVQVDRAVWLRRERGFGKFSRVMTLPIPVDADNVQAKLAQGVLSITLPKSADAKPKKIAVKAE